MAFDLVLLSLGGVQRFIGESRSTADVAGASEIIQKLARTAAETVRQRLAGLPPPCGLIFPATADAPSVTNKIAFLAEEGAGPTVARAAVVEVLKDWRNQLAVTFRGRRPPDTPGTAPDTPGMPDLSWVSVTGAVTEDGYGALWGAAQREMVGRRRARVFEPINVPPGTLCAQSPGLVAVTAPPGALPHERDEALSAAGWVKRHAAGQRFPSTVSIASAAFRRRLLERADTDPDVAAALRGPVHTLNTTLNSLDVPTDRAKLRDVPTPAGLEPLAGRLGAWVTPERWDNEAIAREYGTTLSERTIRDARGAAGALVAIAREAGIPAPSPYFAVVVQDLDRLGRALGGFDLAGQREVSRQLSRLATEQAELLAKRHPLAVLVYAGGDDFLAFCPAADAVQLALSIRQHVKAAVTTGPLATAGPDGTPITASTAVVFAHMSNPLRDALRSAQEAIKAAKNATSASGRSRDALAVLVRRRGGERARTILPWWPPGVEDGVSAVELLTSIRPGPGSGRPVGWAGVRPGARRGDAQRTGRRAEAAPRRARPPGDPARRDVGSGQGPVSPGASPTVRPQASRTVCPPARYRSGARGVGRAVSLPGGAVITTWLSVTPLDTIMVRDGRPFGMGMSGSATSVPPAPNTLGGVVRAALGLDRKVAHHIIGPIVDTRAGVMFPAPRDIVRDGSTVRRLAVTPRDPTAVSDLDVDGRQRLGQHLVGEGDPVPDWISLPGLTDWLTGAMPGGQDVLEPPLWADPAWVLETRLGLARHWSGPLVGTAAPGLLYTMTQLRPREDTRFLVGCVDDEPLDIRHDVVPLGGRGRLAEVAVVTGAVLPDHPADFPGGRLAVYLATPALLKDRWWCPAEAELSAVAVGDPQPVASASPGDDFSGSRLLTWAVPAGSVFFLTFESPGTAQEWAQRHHGGLLPDQLPLPIMNAGFGTCLTGRWQWHDDC
ncbi:MAG: type III-B CRISPR module-associated Cmr3 family protein [Pseudonocardiaceae bacterium]